MDLAERVLAGDQRAIARAISVVENEPTHATALIRQLFPRAGRAKVVGVTGAPGVGKSTLVDRLATEWRRTACRVGILAVDPTSPFSGGAILGDRIRMQHQAAPTRVCMSGAWRPGGVWAGWRMRPSDAAVILDAAGSDIVLIETVGVGPRGNRHRQNG